MHIRHVLFQKVSTKHQMDSCTYPDLIFKPFPSLFFPSKSQLTKRKPSVSVAENKNGGHSNYVQKGPGTWHRSKPVVENKHLIATIFCSILRQYNNMPPPDRILDKAYDSTGGRNISIDGLEKGK